MKFSAANALRLSMLANAAYLDENGAKTAANNLGLPNFIWIDLSDQIDNLYGFAAACNDYAVLSFRGTAKFQDWMTNVNAAPARFSWFFEGAPETGEVHTGFAMAVRHSWEKIKDAVNQLIPPPPKTPDLAGLSTTLQPTFWLTGHSLGAAIAVVCGAAFSMVKPVRLVNGIYTFGQPRIGLYNFCAHYDQLLRLQTFRFVNKEDLVPRVPFRGWDYADLGCMIHFDSKGQPVLQSSQWRNFLTRSIESFKELFDIATHFGVDVGDHNYRDYENLVATHQNELDKLFT
jgi:triacylglycerol lipase